MSIEYKDNTKEIESLIRSAIKSASKQIMIEEIASIQANTPVKSGTLKKSISGNIENNNTKTTIKIGVDGSFVNNKNGCKVEDYATKVEYENKSYIRDTLKNDEKSIKNIFKNSIKKNLK